MFPVGSLFRLRVSHHLGRATFSAPASSNAACGFPALRSPVCFASRLMRPIPAGAAFGLVEPLGLQSLVQPSPYSTAPSRSPVGPGLAELPGRLSLRLDVYSPPQVLQIDGRLCHLVLAFLVVGDFTNSRAPSLHGRYPASTLLRTHPSPSRLRSTSRLSRLYDRPAPAISPRDEEGFSSCSACPCHRAVASTPPKCWSRIDQISAPHSAFALRLGARPSGLLTFEATFAFTVVTAR